jgi:hypothetical protein
MKHQRSVERLAGGHSDARADRGASPERSQRSACAVALSVLIGLGLSGIAAEPAHAAAEPAQLQSSAGFEVLDVQSLKLEDRGQSAIKKYNVHSAKKIHCDVLIVGGGIGGIACALKLREADKRLKVCLTEETDWLGGQMTSQGVSALDENYLIETTGACRSYQQFREGIRDSYEQIGLSARGKAEEHLNPGDSWVTYLAFEPKVALKELDRALSDAINSGALQIFQRTKAVNVQCGKRAGDLRAVTTVQLDTGNCLTFKPTICLDATELGDLLPLSKTAYRVGSDSQEETGELHAPVHGNPDNVQDYVFPFVIDFRPGTDNTIAKPPYFDEFNETKKFSLNDYHMFRTAVLAKEGNRLVESFWSYRRLIARDLFSSPLYPFDVSMINWDSNDLRGYNIIDKSGPLQAERLLRAKALSLGFLYWLQTEAPRDEGGMGYPELQLRKDVLGSPDGLSKFPYIREARRIVAKKTIVEQDIAAATNSGARARPFLDSVGIGFYPVDIHGAQEVRGEGQQSKPFQIPMAGLIPIAGGNLLPACKNIGVTHITNGAYRLHHVEWAIGEAQGALVAFCVRHHKSAAAVLSCDRALEQVQLDLVKGGAPVMWFDDVPTDNPSFASIQICGLRGLLKVSQQDLHFNPLNQVSLGEAAQAICRIQGWNKAFEKRSRSAGGKGAGGVADSGRQGAGTEYTLISDRTAIALVRCHGLFKFQIDKNSEPDPQEPLQQAEFQRLKAGHPARFGGEQNGAALVTRAEFADWLLPLYKHALGF